MKRIAAPFVIVPIGLSALVAGVAGASAPPGSPPSTVPLPPPPGQLIDVDGHEMHIDCRGEGSPTVVLDAGLGDGAVNFGPLQTEIAEFTRVCRYDRAGYGWSEAGPEPRTSQQIVDELGALLDAAGEPGPFLLAGHSFGGLNMILFAAEHPDETAGVVLIDSSHPDQTEALAAVPALVAVQDAEISGLADLIPAAEAGQLAPSDVLANAPALPEDQREVWAELFVQPSSLEATVAEYDALDTSMAEVTANGSLGDIPLVVLAHGRGLGDVLPAEALEQLGLTPEILDQYEDIWRQLQEDHLSRSSNSTLIEAQDSTHYIYFDQPDLVVAAIHDMISGGGTGSSAPDTMPAG
jgi:pimeloyl-ACP methyl ester carboxylesterase